MNEIRILIDALLSPEFKNVPITNSMELAGCLEKALRSKHYKAIIDYKPGIVTDIGYDFEAQQLTWNIPAGKNLKYQIHVRRHGAVEWKLAGVRDTNKSRLPKRKDKWQVKIVATNDFGKTEGKVFIISWVSQTVQLLNGKSAS